VYAFPLKSQQLPVNLKVDYPQFVPSGNKFEIAFVTLLSELNNSDNYLMLEFSDEIELLSAKVRNLDSSEFLFSQKYAESSAPIAYLIQLNKDNINLDFTSPVQIIVELSAYEGNKLEISYSLYEVVNSQLNELTIISGFEQENKFEIQFYLPSLIPQKNVQITEISYYFISFDDDFGANEYCVDFWINFNGNVEGFFYIINEISLDTLLILNNNILNLLTNTYGFNSEIVSESFLSSYVWNHILINISNQNNLINVYLNDKLCIKSELIHEFSITDYDILFQSSKENKVFSLEQFRIWKSDKNLTEEILRRKHFSDDSIEDTNILIELNFDYEDEIQKYENHNIYHENIVFGESNAPLFSKAPVLDVEQYSTYYAIIWKSRDIRNARSFVLEKSQVSGNFIEIYSTDAILDENNEYSYSDYRQKDEGVVYYRIKQINFDSTFVFSPSIKIGTKRAKEFEIIQNFPNPFNPSTNIFVNILINGEYKIAVYNLNGKIVTNIHDGFLSLGKYEFTFDGSDLPSGIYLFEIKSSNFSNAIKMILTK
jgi:hypothetical protein